MSDMLKTYVPTPHPVLYSPTIEDIKRLVNEHGAEETARRLQLREDKIVAEKCDPYRHGYEPEHWKVADKLLIKHRELLINGGNRAGIIHNDINAAEVIHGRLHDFLCADPGGHAIGADF